MISRTSFHSYVPIITTPLFDFLDDQELTPCHMLLIATLYDALVILSKPHLKGGENRIRYEETLAWFTSEEKFPFSYQWICSHLSIDPKRLRQEAFYGSLIKKEKRRRRNRKESIRNHK